MIPNITVAIPSIAPRQIQLGRAIRSVAAQTVPASGLSIAFDVDRDGSTKTRQRALDGVRTTWVAFLDDDDEFLPNHLETLYYAALEHRAEYVYSWYYIGDGHGGMRDDLCPLGHFGKPFDPENPTQTTITTLVRTELAQDVGFVDPLPGQLIGGQKYGEDFEFTMRCLDHGARIHHVPQRTWIWNHHGNNTSGEPDRW